MADIISNIVQDKQDIKYQLGGDIPAVTPVARLWSETIEPVQVVTKFEQVLYDGSANVFLLNSGTYGILGTNKLGDSSSTVSLWAVIPKNNRFVEYFGQTSYIDTGSTTGSISTTTETCTLAPGQLLQSEVIAKFRSAITNVKMLAHNDFIDNPEGMLLPIILGGDTFGGTRNVDIEFSNNGGATWFNGNEAETYTFASTSIADELKYRINNVGTTTLTIDEPIYILVNQ